MLSGSPTLAVLLQTTARPAGALLAALGAGHHRTSPAVSVALDQASRFAA
jgi:hypothetical protein